jgi:hypothetical protein
MYYNARYYDSAIGRFTQPDTIIPDQFNPQSLNRYSYVRNNPVRYTDPMGHCDPDDCYWTPNDNGGWDVHNKTGDEPSPRSPTPGVPSLQPACKIPMKCAEPSPTLAPKPTTGSPSIGAPSAKYPNPQTSKKNSLLPNATIISGSKLAGILGNQYQYDSLDWVIQNQTGQQWLGYSKAAPHYDDFITPQAGGSATWGFYWNLDGPEDYLGTGEVWGFSVLWLNFGAEQYSNNKTWGVFGGYDLSIPFIGAYNIHTYSEPIKIFSPYYMRW